jgi:hypothetical protein
MTYICEHCFCTFEAHRSRRFCTQRCYWDHPRTKEHIQKLLANLKEANGSSSGMKGRHHTPETKAMIANRLLGNECFTSSYDVVCESCKKIFDARTSNGRWCRICCPDSKFRSRLHLYGVSKPMWDTMLEKQNGHCALCEKPATCVDHDHESNVVRGLLCHGCNIALNRVDASGWIEKALEYVSFRRNS